RPSPPPPVRLAAGGPAPCPAARPPVHDRGGFPANTGRIELPPGEPRRYGTPLTAAVLASGPTDLLLVGLLRPVWRICRCNAVPDLRKYRRARYSMFKGTLIT